MLPCTACPACPTLPRPAGLGGLWVDVIEPHNSSQPARFHFRGRASERDLALLEATLQSAMQPRRRGAIQARAVVYTVVDVLAKWAMQPQACPILILILFLSCLPGLAACLSLTLQELQDWGQLFEGTPFGRPLEATVDPFLEHLREFIHGFERMAQGG